MGQCGFSVPGGAEPVSCCGGTAGPFSSYSPISPLLHAEPGCGELN